MSYGLQVFGESGEVVFDTTKITTTFLGTYTTSTTSGSFTPPNAHQVKQLWVALPNLSQGRRFAYIRVWVEGKTIHWSTNKVYSFTCVYGGYS